jgi:5-methylthioribose kinase
LSYELTSDNVVDYLASQGWIVPSEVIAVELLGGGISNTLVKVTTTNDRLVIKQSLAQLRVAGEWFADRDRIQRERECIEVLNRVIPAGSVPQVRYADPENFLFIMSCAPDNGVNWKERLLAGDVDQQAIYRAGSMLGQIHSATAGDSQVREQFIDDAPFIQLRIDPYHWTTAQAHPDLADIIRDEAQRMLDIKEVLVHGDYSPKNFIVGPSTIFLLDFEVVHYGNPAFDLAFMLSHLLLKAVHLAARRSQFFQGVDSFWQGYSSQLSAASGGRSLPALERDSIRQLGCLLLARIDGKSPVEYIIEPGVKDLVRSIARTLLLEEPATLWDVVALVEARVLTS